MSPCRTLQGPAPLYVLSEDGPPLRRGAPAAAAGLLGGDCRVDRSRANTPHADVAWLGVVIEGVATAQVGPHTGAGTARAPAAGAAPLGESVVIVVVIAAVVSAARGPQLLSPSQSVATAAVAVRAICLVADARVPGLIRIERSKASAFVSTGRGPPSTSTATPAAPQRAPFVAKPAADTAWSGRRPAVRRARTRDEGDVGSPGWCGQLFHSHIMSAWMFLSGGGSRRGSRPSNWDQGCIDREDRRMGMVMVRCRKANNLRLAA